VVRPWVRAADGSGELPVPAYDLSSTELLGRLAMEKMLAGLSTPALSGRPGTSRHRGGADGEVDVEVGGVAPVRRGDRDRAREADGRGPVRVGTSRSAMTAISVPARSNVCCASRASARGRVTVVLPVRSRLVTVCNPIEHLPAGSKGLLRSPSALGSSSRSDAHYSSPWAWPVT